MKNTKTLVEDIHIKIMKCFKGHKLKWIGFYDMFDGKIRKYNGLLPPHALLYCPKCGKSFAQRDVYQDTNGKIRVKIEKV